MVAVVLTAWAVWQPEASDRAVDRAVRLAVEGNYDEALAATGDAADADPLSARPALHARRGPGGGRPTPPRRRRTLEQAVLSFPGDPRTWLRLTRLELSLRRPRDALRIVRGALYLDAYSREARTLYVSARSAVRRQEARRAQR